MTALIDPEWLRELPLLEGVDTESLRAMAPWFGTDHFRRNHVIIHEHDPGTKFYIVVRGQVEVTRTALDGSSTVVAVLQDGDYFGELALLNNRLRNATVRTLMPTVCLSLQREHFLRLLESNPAVREHIAQSALYRS